VTVQHILTAAAGYALFQSGYRNSNPERPISVWSLHPLTHIDRAAEFILDLNEPSSLGPGRSIEYDVNLSGERNCGSLCDPIRYDEVVIIGTTIRGHRTPDLPHCLLSRHIRILAGTEAATRDFRRFFAYAGIVPSTCRVSFEDCAGVTHTVSVAASSLCEAAALAIAEFKRCGFAMDGPHLRFGTQLLAHVDNCHSRLFLALIRKSRPGSSPGG
jgi:hypothetical protein